MEQKRLLSISENFHSFLFTPGKIGMAKLVSQTEWTGRQWWSGAAVREGGRQGERWGGGVRDSERERGGEGGREGEREREREREKIKLR